MDKSVTTLYVSIMNQEELQQQLSMFHHKLKFMKGSFINMLLLTAQLPHIKQHKLKLILLIGHKYRLNILNNSSKLTPI